jgi:hypothetical protein
VRKAAPSTVTICRPTLSVAPGARNVATEVVFELGVTPTRATEAMPGTASRRRMKVSTCARSPIISG